MSISKQVFIDCMNYAPVMVLGSGGAAAGADNTVSHMQLGPYCMEIRHEQALDADDSICWPRLIDADCCNGLQISIDTDDNQGLEATFGQIPDTNSAHIFTVATDPAFFFEVKMGIPDVSDFDVAAIGFRGVGTAASAVTYIDAIVTEAEFNAAYDEKACLNVAGGDVHTVVSKAGSDDVTDTTDNIAGDETNILRVNVSATGAVTFQHDIAAAGTRAAPTTVGTTITTLTAGMVTPFLFFRRNGAGGLDTPIIEYMAYGYQ